MPPDSSTEAIAAKYVRFARNEASGRSLLYEELALGVANEPSILGFLSELPLEKRQPNLLFAAARHVCGVPACFAAFSRLFMSHSSEIRETMMRRRTQTNEPARCATILPLLALLPQPLALLEVGASAGLCLLPDRYAYRYNDLELEPVSSTAVKPPRFPCAVNRETPLPAAKIDVVWRMGLDLEPIDVQDGEQTSWLEALVWPGEEQRLERLRQALKIARVEPPTVVRADLRTGLAALAEQAPRAATLVVFHSAVLAYVSSESDRAQFAETVRQLGAVWIANESPTVTPNGAAYAHLCHAGEFLVSQNAEPVASSDPHGRSLRWFA